MVTDNNANAADTGRITLYRGQADAILARLREAWSKRWVRWTAIILSIPILFYILLWLLFARGLPSAESLLTYQPPLPTNVRDINGDPAQTFARERRVELSYEEFPQTLINAFVAVEDRTFFTHGGLDYPAFIKAIFNYALNVGSGERVAGGSTITQQVAKNLLLGDEYSATRKIKEVFLARRMEDVLTKEQILELYLNQIFLGRNAYGVQAASRAYFGKDVGELQLHEAAYLAILPKAPSAYTPERDYQKAIARRNFVLSEMERNELITPAQRAQASAMPLGTVRGTGAVGRNVGGYFMEEVRRQLIGKYGEGGDASPNGVYQGGLWVRTSYDDRLQQAAAEALRDGLMRFDGNRGWRDPGLSIPVDGDWQGQLARAAFGVGYRDWKKAVVLERGGGSVKLGFADGSTGTMPSWGAGMPKRGTGTPAYNFLKPGMIIAVKPEGANYVLRTLPEIRGGMVVEQVGTGRVLAMQGGFDVVGDDFNRATQAKRQPGSTFKPIVYSAALDNGMTPASIIVDGPFCVASAGEQKCFRNSGGGFAGPQTMRWGLEQSRNAMTVRAASQTGMDKVTKLARALGVGEYPAYLAISLGAGETTVMAMTNAFAIMANQGRALTPTVVDYVQDRSGKVIYRADNRCSAMDNCNAKDWDGKMMPRPPRSTKLAMDPMTAYQMVHILEGVVERGTATTLRSLNRPLFGKTGTTTGPRDVWFIGGTPDIVAGVYLGYDRPRSLGGYAQGGRISAPIFKDFMEEAMKDVPAKPFAAPDGIRMVRIDRRSGRKVFGTFPTSEDPKSAVIWEAFKPETEPRRSARTDEVARPVRRAVARPKASTAATAAPKDAGDSDFLQREGGIY